MLILGRGLEVVQWRWAETLASLIGNMQAVKLEGFGFVFFYFKSGTTSQSKTHVPV